jgi:hypothetical protein
VARQRLRGSSSKPDITECPATSEQPGLGGRCRRQATGSARLCSGDGAAALAPVRITMGRRYRSDRSTTRTTTHGTSCPERETGVSPPRAPCGGHLSNDAKVANNSSTNTSWRARPKLARSPVMRPAAQSLPRRRSLQLPVDYLAQRTAHRRSRSSLGRRLAPSESHEGGVEPAVLSPNGRTPAGRRPAQAEGWPDR